MRGGQGVRLTDGRWIGANLGGPILWDGLGGALSMGMLRPCILEATRYPWRISGDRDPRVVLDEDFAGGLMSDGSIRVVRK
jgi:hypothetical protein